MLEPIDSASDDDHSGAVVTTSSQWHEFPSIDGLTRPIELANNDGMENRPDDFSFGMPFC